MCIDGLTNILMLKVMSNENTDKNLEDNLNNPQYEEKKLIETQCSDFFISPNRSPNPQFLFDRIGQRK